MKNPIDAFFEFLDALPEDYARDMAMHIAMNELGESSAEIFEDPVSVIRKTFFERKEEYLSHRGICLKIQVFVEHYLENFSEESEDKQMQFFDFVDSEENPPASSPMLRQSYKNRAVYWRDKKRDWDDIADQYFTREAISNYGNRLFRDHAPG